MLTGAAGRRALVSTGTQIKAIGIQGGDDNVMSTLTQVLRLCRSGLYEVHGICQAQLSPCGLISMHIAHVQESWLCVSVAT